MLDATHKQWKNISKVYRLCEEQKPIVLFDLQEQRVYVYPYKEFKGEMAPKSQESLAEQYEKALLKNKIVVLVRDNDRKRLVSFSMDYK